MKSPYDRAPDISRHWRDSAACAGMDVTRFYPAPQSPPNRARQALEVCERCPVRQQCLADALLRGERHGVWGGVVEADRVMIPAPPPLSWHDAMEMAFNAIRPASRAAASA